MNTKLKRLVMIAAAGSVAGMLIGLPLLTLANLALALGIVVGARIALR